MIRRIIHAPSVAQETLLGEGTPASVDPNPFSEKRGLSLAPFLCSVVRPLSGTSVGSLLSRPVAV
ncbi:hypothetical protein THIOKS12240007 [Thiocapsa sp. KS1]|nr:hypothetical protein THIOKS12240007 [Thiocapsa sp. KS1]